jgi:hypothetical protein
MDNYKDENNRIQKDKIDEIVIWYYKPNDNNYSKPYDVAMVEWINKEIRLIGGLQN